MTYSFSGIFMPILFFIVTLTSFMHLNGPDMLEILPGGNISIRYENISYEIDPNLGARIISAKIDGKELLLQERDGLVNWGSTFWLAPQSLWNWPPPQALHRGKYQSIIEGDILKMTSEVDDKFGVRALKEFRYNSQKKCLEILYTMVNETDSTVQYGPWEVTVVPAEGSCVFFALGDEPENTKSNLVFEDHNGIGWFSYDHEKSDQWHKTFNNAAEGWLAHINANKILFVKTFEVVQADQLAKKQGNVEVYVSKEMRYIELENHGKFSQLNPGDSLVYKVNWYISTLPESISSDSYSEDLVKLVRDILSNN